MATTIRERASGSSALRSFYREFFSDPILQAFYGDSGFANLGYWDEATADAGEAGDRLVDALLELIPERSGTILDVACGQGGSTRRLASYFEPSAITAIGISRDQLAAARQRAPGCRFLEMDATELRFADSSFDNVICVEAAFHFRSRERFLAEALRVLKPGGHLVLSDLVMSRGTPLVPPENHLPDRRAYARLLARCGFVDVVVIDATRETWRAFRRRFTAFVLGSASRYASPLGVRDLLAANLACAWAIRASLLAAGRRP